jgi:hypothetical protein
LPRLAPAVLALAQDPAAARIKAEEARDFVFQRYAQTMNVVRDEVLAAMQTHSA